MGTECCKPVTNCCGKKIKQDECNFPSISQIKPYNNNESQEPPSSNRFSKNSLIPSSRNEKTNIDYSSAT